MDTTEANIEITRINGKLSKMSIIMPTWSKPEYDGTFSVSIPLFGLKTYANNENDSDIAIQESLTAFGMGAERFGQGIEKELQTLGWAVINQDDSKSQLSYSIGNSNMVFDVIEEIFQTSDTFAHANIEME